MKTEITGTIISCILFISFAICILFTSININSLDQSSDNTKEQLVGTKPATKNKFNYHFQETIRILFSNSTGEYETQKIEYSKIKMFNNKDKEEKEEIYNAVLSLSHGKVKSNLSTRTDWKTWRDRY